MENKVKSIRDELSAEFGDRSMANQQAARAMLKNIVNSGKCQLRPGCRLFGTIDCDPLRFCHYDVVDGALDVGEVKVAVKKDRTGRI